MDDDEETDDEEDVIESDRDEYAGCFPVPATSHCRLLTARLEFSRSIQLLPQRSRESKRPAWNCRTLQPARKPKPKGPLSNSTLA